ncbi:exopolysaccharide biosynthesis protein [Afifella sp. IM 167]|uniref:exopolysaccharide biosynthesis protein n=1 Tax=Afifella sp. IM 167 TaxID=2033586 RepID=UPI001CCE4DE4|nr:exopolysaccharide biosynthesis protein [Afifella sp. IM 167]MBZ8133293.1 hypothetical protein [Afifella sp. IM 167]
MRDEPHSVEDILDRLEGRAERRGRVSLADLADAVGPRSYGPFLIVPALIELSPIGAIPGLPSMIALVVVIFAAQMLFGREHLWLPGFVARRHVSEARLKDAVEKVKRPARRFDRWFHGRWTALTTVPFVRVAAIVVILLAASVPPLELIPFASSAPMSAIAAFGVALLVRDGMVMAVALLVAAAALALSLAYLLSGGFF